MNSDLVQAIWPLLLSIVLPILVMLACRLTVERWWPIAPARKSRKGMNIVSFLIWFSTQIAFAPGTVLLGTLLANRLGGGFIVLPSHGWALVGGFLAYFLLMDLLEFLYHRAQHSIPWLWAVHSLHHSDPEFDATTSVLHHWLSPAIKSFAVTVPLGLVLKVPPIYLAIYSVLGYHAYFYHANLKISFGRFAWLLNAPSYHRLHHSASIEHFNCNYAASLPLFDVLSGTYRPARPGQWPAVGLEDGGHAKDVFDLLFWPVRGRLRGLTRSPTPGVNPGA